jgi:pimeloyl-ACP methyl ester carboxylesterase
MGEGSRTALLIHGWAGSSRQYRRIARRLAGEGYRCVVVDLPAHGMEAGRSTDALEIAAALEAAGTTLGRVDIVVAHSLGALGTALAMRSSLRADRLVLVAPGLSPRHALDSFAEMLHLRPKVARAVERSMEQRFGDDLWERIPREVLDLTIPGRTLIIQDTDDDMIPIERTRALAERWGVELVTTRGHGHNGVLRAAEVIDRIAGLACMDPAPA